MPNAPRKPWTMFLPLAAMLLLALLWSIYWFVASGIAKERVAGERARLAARGLSLVCTEERWGGYPFHFEFTCTSPVLTLRDEAEVRSGSALLMAQAYRPWQVVALIDGPTTVSARGMAPARAEHQRIIAAVTLERDGRLRASADIPALAVDGYGNAARLMLHGRPADGGATDIAVEATDVTWQQPERPPLHIDKGELLGTLSRDMAVKVDRIALQQGELRYWGAGNLSLGADRRISGRLDTETNDVNALLGLLEPHLRLSEKQRAGLRAMLGLLGSEAKAPIIARDGVLYVGPFKVADLPPLY